MKKMNKKGQLFIVMLAIITFVLLVFAYTKLSHRYNFRTEEGITKNLGDLQFELIDKYAEGEAYLFYLDQASKYALDLDIYYLAEAGGYFTGPVLDEPLEHGAIISQCGNYKGYEIWATPDKECYPDYENNFKEYFNLFFFMYAAQYDLEDIYFDFNIDQFTITVV